MKINIKYMLVFLVLLKIEVLIALFVKDAIVRPYVGDILVIILMYTFIRGIIKKSIQFLPIYLFVFSLTVEMLQYYRIVDVLHLQDNKVMAIIIGTSYDTKDILCYSIATIILITWENIEIKR